MSKARSRPGGSSERQSPVEIEYTYTTKKRQPRVIRCNCCGEDLSKGNYGQHLRTSEECREKILRWLEAQSGGVARAE